MFTLIFLLLPRSAPADPSPSALADKVSKRASPGKALIIDASLAQAAEHHANEILQDPTLATRTRVEAALTREGLADAQVLPFSSLGEDPNALAAALVEFADRSKHRGATHLGLAFAKRNERRALVAILSRRLVTVAPLATSPRAEPMVVRGRVLPGVKVDALLLGPCTSRLCLEAGVEPLEIARKNDLISLRVPLDRGNGRYTIELLAERDRGPEVAALWTFAVGVPARGPQHSLRSTEKSDAGALETLIHAAREERELAPLSRNKLLDRAAQKHAEAVCRVMVAAHVLQGRDPPRRARSEGYRGAVSENVAIAQSVSSAHENFLSSPSHRVNVFSPVVADLGLGVASRSTTPPAVCVVELYGR